MSAVDVVVIGAGANGLTAAAGLARAGRRVLVLEPANAVGGQARLHEFAPGFRVSPLAEDAGWVPPEVARLVDAPARAVPAVPLTVAVEPGRYLALARDPARASESIRASSPGDAGRWPSFVARLHRLSGMLAALYERPAPAIDASLRELSTLLPVARRFRALGSAEMVELLRVVPMPVAQVLDEWFELDALKAGVAAGGLLDVRQGPRSGGTGFVLLHHLVGAPEGVVRGRGHWVDGPDAFVIAAHAAALRHGATVRTGAAVAGILVRDDAVAGVRLDTGEEIAASRVLSTADPARTFGMVDPVWLDPEVLHAVGNIRYRGSTAYVLYALDGLPQIPGLEDAPEGVLSLTGSTVSLERAADAAKYGDISEPLHVEVTIPTLRWPVLAPEGRHVLVARVRYVPHALRDGAAWDRERTDALGDAAGAAIAAHLPDFASRVLHRSVLSSADLERTCGLTEGASSHGELGLDQILFMRPLPGWSRYALPVEGLYLGGAGAHPGPGVTGGAGWLAAQRMLKDGR